MALSLLCGGLGVAEASVHVDESGVTYEVLTKQEVTAELDKKVSMETADAKYAKATNVATNTTNIGTNANNINKLENNKLDKDVASATYATKDALNTLQTAVNDKVDESTLTTALDDKANTDLSNLTADGVNKIKNTMSEDMENKANKADVYSKTDADDTFATKTELNAKADATELAGKANKTDLENATNRITTNEGNIADLQKKTANLSDDGKELKGMTTVEAGALTVKEEISNGAGVTTTLAAIDASMTQTETNKTEIAALQNKTDGQQTAIDGLNTKTTEISYDPAKGTTVKGVEFTDAEVDANGKRLTGVSTLHTTGDATVGGALNATGKVSGKGLDAGTEAITGGSLSVTGAVTGSSVNAGTLSTTGNATVGGALGVTGATTLSGELTAEKNAKFEKDVTVDGTTNLKNTTVTGDLKVTGTITTDKMIFGEVPNNYTEIDHGKVTSTNLEVRAGEMISSSSTFDVEKNEVGFGNGITDEQSSHKQTSDVITDTVKNNNTGDQSFHKQTSDVIMDNVKDGKNSNNRTQTKTETKDIITDENGNSSTTSQTASQNKTYLKDKDGKNTNSTIDTAKEYDKTIKGENGKTSTKQTATDITNTAEQGTITNTAKKVTNEGTESVTNKVGTNEVKVSKDGVDIKAEDGKKIKESVGTASRVVENDKITDNAGDSTVTTEKDKGTTFGKAGIADTTNIYGDSIKTGTINAKDTTTGKLTAGAAADANGGRLTVDANDGVKGSYTSGNYTSRSYILANTLKSGVDNGKEPTEADFVGSRTDHYMDGNKPKLDETVKDTAGSNVTNKTSTGTVTTITDGTTTTKTEQDTKDITNTAKNGTITNDAKDIVTNASNSITEKVGDTNVTEKTTTSSKSEIQNADTITSVQQTENMVQSYVGKKDLSATNVTTNSANASANQVTENGQISTVLNNKDGLLIQNNANGNSFTTADGTNTGPALEWTNIKGNEISTGKVEANYVKMSYADVMKDLGVRGNANINGKTTTGSLEVTGTSKLTGDVTMENNATVGNNLTVNGTTKTKTLSVTENATVGGTLDVTGKATFKDSVSIAKDLTVGGDVTAKSYKVGGNTYISADGINANDQKITNVADGSISEGSKDAVNGGQLYQVKNDLEGKVNKVGANAAAMANLHPMEFDPDSKWNIAAAMGNYGSETATAIGAFYRPNEDVMVNFSTAFGTGENMVGGGVSVRLGKGSNKLSRQESNALKAQVDDLTARMDALLSVLNPNMSKDFPDVPENHWAYEAVSRLAGNDIVQGYPDGEFHGDRTMTRYEMAEIIYNALSRGAEAERELVEEFKPELQAMAASEKATAERAEG